MSLRETIEKNSMASTIAAVALLLVAVLFGAWWAGFLAGPAEKASGQWFYDAKTGTLYGVELDAISPGEAPSGGAGVKAYIFARDCDPGCGQQDFDGVSAEQLEEMGLYIGYLERYSAAGLKAVAEIRESSDSVGRQAMKMDDVRRKQTEVRALDARDDKWANINSGVMSKIGRKLAGMCPGEARPPECLPGLGR